jgi:succinate dehydrogenase / fumarate reductase, cytochrome b subunit
LATRDVRGVHLLDRRVSGPTGLPHLGHLCWHPTLVSWFVRYLRSSIGAKHAMAVSGLLLLLFAVVHMVGHLQMFGGAALYNRYANFLQDLWEVKWPVRIGLIALLILHVAIAIGLVAKNRSARPVGYAVYRPRRARLVGRSMAVTGIVVLAFLIFHINHFTLAPSHPGNAYRMFVVAFQSAAFYAIYLVGILLLALHLGHGAAVWMQSLGLRHPKYPADRLGTLIAGGLFVGYMLPPTAVLVGLIQ